MEMGMGMVMVSRDCQVHRYRRHLSVSNLTSPIPYRYFLWSEHAETVLPMDAMIASHHIEFNWNDLDQLTAGYRDNFTNSLKYRRLRYAIVPPTQTPNLAEKFVEFMESLTGKSIDRLGIVVGGDGHPSHVVGVSSVKIELHSLHRHRHEWFLLQYDTVFDSRACFHLEAQWLVATGLQMQRWLAEARQKAKDCGLSFIQIPADQVLPSSTMRHLHPRLHRHSHPHPRVHPIPITVPLASEFCGSIPRDAVNPCAQRGL